MIVCHNFLVIKNLDICEIIMAEARLAVAFQFAVSDEGVVVNLNKEILKLMANSAYKTVKRRCNDAKNTFLKGNPNFVV